MSDDIKKGLLGIVVDETEVSKVMPEINSLIREFISGITFETSVSSTTIPSKPFFMSSLIIHVHQY